MLINTIIDQLTKPQIRSDGTIRVPTAIELKAAGIIQSLLQAMIVIDHQAEYRKVMNDDYIKNCT